jgi:hypothetical protein
MGLGFTKEREKERKRESSLCYFVLLTRNWGIVTASGCPRVNRPHTLTWGGQILTLHLNYVAYRSQSRPRPWIGFWFLVCKAATQLDLQLQQKRIQVVRSTKVVRRIPIESNGTPAMDVGLMIWKHTHTQMFQQHQNRSKHTAIKIQHVLQANINYGWKTHTWHNNESYTDNHVYLFVCSYILVCIQCIQVLIILFINLCVCLYISLRIQVIIILFMNLCFSCILYIEFVVSFYIHYVSKVSLFDLCGYE